MIRLANRFIQIDIDPAEGGQIMSVQRPGRPNVLASYGWRSPLPASHSTSYGDEASDWLSEYRGGWQELFPNAGAGCIAAGVSLPFHGEVSRARWRVDAQTDQSIAISTPARLPMVLERRLRIAPDRAVLLVEETARSESDIPMPFLWGHHPAFQAEDGARIDLPPGAIVVADTGFDTELNDITPGARGAWPTLDGPGGDSVTLDRVPSGPVQRLAYLTQLGREPWAAIRHIGSEGMAMAWDGDTFPNAWFWWEIGGPGHPWHGRARIVAIEPNTSYPADGLSAAVERGEAHLLPPGGEHRTWLTMSLFDADELPIRGVSREGGILV